MSEASTIEGGCRCGAVRFRAEGGSLWVSHCHCEECRRSSGAPVSTFVGVRDTGFAFVAGTPGAYESSPDVVRKFCGACGTPLTYEAAVYPGEVHIMAGTLDERRSHSRRSGTSSSARACRGCRSRTTCPATTPCRAAYHGSRGARSSPRRS